MRKKSLLKSKIISIRNPREHSRGFLIIKRTYKKKSKEELSHENSREISENGNNDLSSD